MTYKEPASTIAAGKVITHASAMFLIVLHQTPRLFRRSPAARSSSSCRPEAVPGMLGARIAEQLVARADRFDHGRGPGKSVHGAGWFGDLGGGLGPGGRWG